MLSFPENGVLNLQFQSGDTYVVAVVLEFVRDHNVGAKTREMQGRIVVVL